MAVNTLEEGEINDLAGEQVVMEDMGYAKIRNKVIKPKERVAGETGPELSPDEELRAQFSTVRKCKDPKKSLNARLHKSVYFCTSTILTSVPICALRTLKVKLTLHKALIRSVMIHACPAW
jgi:hypothetical protein